MLQIGQHAEEHGFDEPLGLLSDCHRRIERFLAVLLKVADEFRGQTLTPEAVNAIKRAREYFAQAAPRHTADEEESLFPRMRAAAAERGLQCQAIQHLESDHIQAGALHEQADRLLDHWLAAGGLSQADATELRETLQRLQALYAEHIRQEDQEVFPLAAQLLSQAQLAEVGQEMRSRRGLS